MGFKKRKRSYYLDLLQGPLVYFSLSKHDYRLVSTIIVGSDSANDNTIYFK